jgi:hypothetical protein
MAKACDSTVLGGLLNIVSGANKLIVCSGQPTTYTQANVTYNLASIAVAGGDFTLANSGSNRQSTVAAKSALTVNAAGTGDHIALVNTGSSTLLYVTTIGTARAIALTDTVNTSSWVITVNQPT